MIRIEVRNRPPAWRRFCKGGLELLERGAGNYELAAYKGLLIKGSYWRWPERNMGGNAIDLFTKVLGLSFHEAMRLIAAR